MRTYPKGTREKQFKKGENKMLKGKDANKGKAPTTGIDAKGKDEILSDEEIWEQEARIDKECYRKLVRTLFERRRSSQV